MVVVIDLVLIKIESRSFCLDFQVRCRCLEQYWIFLKVQVKILFKGILVIDKLGYYVVFRVEYIIDRCNN